MSAESAPFRGDGTVALELPDDDNAGGVPEWAWWVGGAIVAVLLFVGGLAAVGAFKAKKPVAEVVKAEAKVKEKPKVPPPAIVAPKVETPKKPIEPVIEKPKDPERTHLEEVGGEKPVALKNGTFIAVVMVAPKMFNDDTLSIVVAVGTNNPDKKFDFTAWRGLIDKHGRTRLADDKGNTYRPVPYDFEIEGVIFEAMKKSFGDGLKFGSGPIYKNDSRMDILRYELPVGTAEYLDLDVDCKNVGSDEVAKFRIKRSAFKVPR